MSRAFLECASIDDAEALVGAATAAAGLPRCGHMRHAVGDEQAVAALAQRGRVPWCLCADPADPHPDCVHVTWAAEAIVRAPDGDYLVTGAERIDAASRDVRVLDRPSDESAADPADEFELVEAPARRRAKESDKWQSS